MKRLLFVGLAVTVLIGLGVASPAQAMMPSSSPQAKPAIKCVNLNTGVIRNLAGKKCPKGWAKEASSGASTASKKRAAYLSSARRLEPALYGVDDDTLFRAGRSICRTLDAGGNFAQIINTIISAGLDSSTGAALIVASIEHLCPGHKQFLNNFLYG
jgi:hypothetical protein